MPHPDTEPDHPFRQRYIGSAQITLPGKSSYNQPLWVVETHSGVDAYWSQDAATARAAHLAAIGREHRVYQAIPVPTVRPLDSRMSVEQASA